jgi:hypothetical protein
MKLRVLRDKAGQIIATSEPSITEVGIEPEPEVEEGQLEEIEVPRRYTLDLQALYERSAQKRKK